MRKPTVLFLSSLLAIISFTCCQKPSSSACYFYNSPSSLILLLKMNGQVVPDTILNKVKLSYFEGAVKKYVADFSIATNGYPNMGFIGTRTIGTMSADSSIKTYYLEYANNWKTDTLFADYLSRSPATNCLYVLQTIKFNNQSPTIDTSFHFDSKVYVLNKQ